MAPPRKLERLKAQAEALAEAKAEAQAEPDSDAHPEPKPQAEAPPIRVKRRYTRRAQAQNVNMGELPPEVIAVISQAPLILSGMAIKVATRKTDAQTGLRFEGVQLHFDRDSIDAVGPAFKAWLASIDIAMSPGWALLVLYSMALTSAAPDAFAQIAEFNARVESAKNGASKNGESEAAQGEGVQAKS